MSHEKKIKDLMEKGGRSDRLVATIDVLMKERHQQFSEIMKMPIPLVEAIMERIEKEKKKEEAEMKKVRRR